MATYKFYKLDPSGRVGAPGQEFTCEGDDEAMVEVQTHASGGYDYEIWEGARLVANLPRERGIA